MKRFLFFIMLSIAIHLFSFSIVSQLVKKNTFKRKKTIEINVGMKNVEFALYHSTKQKPEKKKKIEKKKKEKRKLPLENLKSQKKEEKKTKDKSKKKIADNEKDRPQITAASPKSALNRPPSYPWEAIRNGYEGSVIFSILINENGKVEQIRLLKSSGHKILDEHSAYYVSKWQFEPAQRNGGKIKSWLKLPPISYRLKKF